MQYEQNILVLRTFCFMRPYILCLLLLIMVLRRNASAQEYSYHQYTIKDGLAGETVYDITQDHQGFLWIATEAGLSRFDGRNFRNFSTVDGLPSREIFGCREDSKHRLWIMSFSRFLCYYKDGKIYNRYNDPLLKKIVFQGELRGIMEDRLNRMLFRDISYNLYIIHMDGKMEYHPRGSYKLDYRLLKVGSEDQLSQLAMPEQVKQRVYDFFSGTGVPPDAISVLIPAENVVLFRGVGRTLLWHPADHRFFELFHGKNARFYKALDNGSVPASIVGATGAYLYDYKSGIKKNIFFDPFIVNNIFCDRDHNLWFSTKGNGLLRLNNTKVLDVPLGKKYLPIRFVMGNDNGVWAGTENDECWNIHTERGSITDSVQPWYRQKQFSLSKEWLQKNAVNTPVKMHHTLFPRDSTGHVKSTYAFEGGMLVAASNGAFVCTVVPGGAYDIKKIYGRTTTAMRYGAYYYVGTLEGLFIIDTSYKIIAHLLSYPINSITPGENNILWLATHGNGVFGIKDHKVVAQINEANSGLSSDLCTYIHASGKELWIATNKGLNQVMLGEAGSSKVKQLFTTTNGLNSDEITAVYVRDSAVWVGTQKGLNVILKESTYSAPEISLQFTGITVADRILPLNAPITIPHDENRIKFDFSAILFSAERVSYHYRIIGLNNNWVETEEPSLSFLSLPSGQYTLQVKALSALGQESALIQKTFNVERAFYETWWFRTLVLLFFGTLVLLFLRYRIRRIRSQEAIKSELARKVTELEQMALRAQMNPHFIFNCLNSVQNYIVRKDSMGASIYLSRFATLIRKTLDNAGSLYIPLREELAYLESYIELEKLQANHPFAYTIEVAPSINTITIAFPNMILQPFVENAIKHGMPYAGLNAHLTVNFTLIEDKRIVCIIEDNGPGIYAAKNEAARYRSKGMEITQQRVAILNQLNNLTTPIVLLIEDLAAAGSTGTRISITVPLKE
ncbi:MAG: hypothetical protein EOP54_00655 [Sphingobacteriales bacterium]|nr:MAG: hypothetical protein EOP54_00655 [Sphingobacteriales bacterium]